MGVLYRWVTSSKKDQNVLQLVIPKTTKRKLCKDVMMTLDIWDLSKCWICTGTNFIDQEWLRMQNFTLQSVSNAFNSKVNHRGQQWRNIQATYPLQLMHLDYLTIEMTKGGKDVHMVITTDHFTRYAWALITSLHTAKCTAQTLWDQFVVHYGLPESIISDKGSEFWEWPYFRTV